MSVSKLSALGSYSPLCRPTCALNPPAELEDPAKREVGRVNPVDEPVASAARLDVEPDCEVGTERD